MEDWQLGPWHVVDNKMPKISQQINVRQHSTSHATPKYPIPKKSNTVYQSRASEIRQKQLSTIILQNLVNTIYCKKGQSKTACHSKLTLNFFCEKEEPKRPQKKRTSRRDRKSLKPLTAANYQFPPTHHSNLLSPLTTAKQSPRYQSPTGKIQCKLSWTELLREPSEFRSMCHVEKAFRKYRGYHRLR